jgi:hypothetical protein
VLKIRENKGGELVNVKVESSGRVQGRRNKGIKVKK